MRRRILISWLLLSIPGLPDAARPQEQFFVDETVERMPARTDRSEDGDLGDLNGDGYLDFVISNGYYGGRYKSIMRLNAGETSTTGALLGDLDYVRAVDRMGNVAFDPPAAPDSVYTFRVEVGQGRDDDLE